MRPLFRYYGSKACMVPQDTRTLISLFMGMLEYNYALSHLQCNVVCYDIDPAMVNFHQQTLKDRPHQRDVVVDELHRSSTCTTCIRADSSV